MFFGIPQPYTIDIFGFYFEEYMLGYLAGLKTTPILYNCQGQTLFWPRPAHNEY